MPALEQPTFRTDASKQIYQYVERHGTAARHRTMDAIGLSPEQFREELEWLLTKGYLEDDGGTLRIDLNAGSVEKLQCAAQLTVGVRGEVRNNGIGSRLLERGLDWAEANGYRKVYNSVPATNDAALAFLESHGWETEGIRREHYDVDDALVDEVMMAYQLADG